MMKRKNRQNAREEGSALLISLMVMVGLSLLGLGFVAISETESAIAVNERNAAQALFAAEVGAKVAVEWFQDAEWALRHNVLPPNSNAFKIIRNLTTAKGPVSHRYKQNAGELLFDLPFKVADTNRFFGNVNTPDVLISLGANTAATNYLNALNAQLFSDDTIRISEIRVYSPPVVGGLLINATAGQADTGFWDPDAGVRYGVATVRLTGQKLGIGDQVVATRSVTMVLAETPFPTVDGAIETSGSLVGQGNFHVYWGKILSEKNTQVNRPAVGMPWFDAKEQMNFEYGYNSTAEWTPDTPYTDGAIVNAPNSAISVDGNLAKFSYRCKCPGGGISSVPANAPAAGDWPKKVGDALTEKAPSTLVWIAEPSRPYRLDPTDFYTQVPWLYALLDRSIADPWLHVRARGPVTLDNNKQIPCGSTTAPHPCDFAALNDVVTGRLSNVFQNQTFTEKDPTPESIEVFFPTMDYEFWKTVAQSGDNQPGNDLYYFKYDKNTDEFIGPNGVSKPIGQWLNAKKNGLGAGFYFFDTANGKNPQYGKGGELTPDVDVNAQLGKDWQMQGYIYMNAKSFGTTGQGNMAVDDLYQMPGEPFRDIGYRVIDPVKKTYLLSPDTGSLPTADFTIEGRNNGIWSFQDTNENGVFDWVVEKNTKPLTRPNAETIPVNTVWTIKPWEPGCTIGDLSDMSKPVWGTCSEPHEPYVNMVYPDIDHPKDPVTIGWYDKDDELKRRPKAKLGVNNPVPCEDKTSLRDCTSNGYDQDGALVTLAPILYGALYNEGGYSGSGNAVYYGAVLMRGNFDASGSPEVFFNECLARGCLESQLDMQRVMITSYETDQ